MFPSVIRMSKILIKDLKRNSYIVQLNQKLSKLESYKSVSQMVALFTTFVYVFKSLW